MELDKRMKQEYTKSMSVTTFIIGSILAIGFGIWQINYGLGLFLGLFVGQVNFYLTTNYIDNLFFKERFETSSFIFYAVINYGLMILAFLLSVTFPNWVSIYMVALGLIMLKLVIYIKEIGFYKKGGSKK